MVMVVDLFPVLPQQVLAVVVAVESPHHGVDMISRGFVVVQEDTILVVELDKNYRTVHPVIEDAVLISAAHPGKVGPLEMLLYLVHFELGVIGTHSVDIGADQIEHEGLLMAGKVIKLDALMAHLKIIPEGAGEDAGGDLIRDFALLRCPLDSVRARFNAVPSSAWKTRVPACLPMSTATGSEPMNIGVITIWPPNRKQLTFR